MSLIQTFIRRPVLTSAISIMLLLLGIVGLFKMPVRFLPAMEEGLINISTAYPGADGQVVKSFVTSKIQNTIIGVEGVDYVAANSTTGTSEIKVYLMPGVDTDKAVQTITSKLSGISGDLPPETMAPAISKQNKDNNAMMIVGFSSQKMNAYVVTDYLRRVIEPQIEAVDGVAQAQVWGDQYAMQIWLNPAKLAAYSLSAQDVVDALRTQNVLASPGQTQGHYFNYQLSISTNLHTPDEFNNIVVKTLNNVPVYLKDVGEAKIGDRDDNFKVYYDRKPTTMIGVTTLPSSNPLTVIAAVKEKLPQLAKSLPRDLQLNIILDRTRFIENSIHEVAKTLIESILIVILVMFLFLGDIRTALIPALTIPLSLLGICFFMLIMGYSINTITLLAMVLGVGLVVDDAIVVVENIVRHVRPDKPMITTTIQSTQELIVPVIAMTITLMVVYMPIGFTGGLIGQLFKEFAFVLGGSVVISGFLALSLSPMMGARLIHPEDRQKKIAVLAERYVGWLQAQYRRVLLQLFHLKKGLVILWAILVLAAGYMYTHTPQELTPTENQGFLIAMGSAPTNANRAYIDHYAMQAINTYKPYPDIVHNAAIISTGYNGFLISDRSNPKASLLPIVSSLQQQLAKIPGLEMRVIVPSILGGGSAGMQFVITSSGTYQSLDAAAKIIEQKAMASGMFMYLFDDLNFSNPQAQIKINNQAATAADVSMGAIANAVSSLMSNRQIQQFSANDQSYDVVIKMPQEYQLNPEDLANVPVPTNHQTTVPLGSVASLNYEVVPTALNQFQKLNSITLSGALRPGVSLSIGVDKLKTLAADNLPKNTFYDFSGTARQFLQEGHRMLLIFALAIFVIFLVLSIQFESYKDSLIILLGSVPLALFAALLPLYFGLGTINIYTQIGLLTLVGLISKHGILIARFANELRASTGIKRDEAVIEAAILRFRPILMTTAAILFGAVPLITASGAGSGSRHAIGVVIGFGMGLGTVLTLLLMPIVYSILARKDLVR